MQKKLAIMVILIMLALFSLVCTIYRIVDRNQDSYSQIVLSQQEYDSRVIPYRRGDIVDRNGTCLATTEKVYNLILDPKQIMSDEENYLEPTLQALSKILGFDMGELRGLIKGNGDKYYIRYKEGRQLSYDQKEAFETYAKTINEENAKSNDEAVFRQRVKGVWFEDEYRRIYPNDSLACGVIGFTSGDGKSGNGGIEQYYNDQLIGTNGREYGYLNDDSNLERVIKGAVNGNTIVSTIDVNIQKSVEKYIKEWQEETGSERAAAIVMDPNNGEILAMSSDKMFNLNAPREAAGHYTDEELYNLGIHEAVLYNKRHPKVPKHPEITEEEVPEYYSDDEIHSFGLQAAWSQEWRNFCVSDTYEPGSPSKIFTVAAAMEEGVIDGTESFFCDGFQDVDDRHIRCVNRNGHGNLTVAESLMQSCNDAMMQIAMMTGRERFCRYQQMFGFGSKTGIDLPAEADTKNLVYNVKTMKPVDLASSSFGQTYNCTMVQMAAAYCSVINGGSYYEPHVVRQILNSQGATVRKMEPRLARETVSENTSNFIREALLRTVEEGTGKAAAVEGYEIAGKTGTAQKIPRSANNYLVSFCGFAPARDPKVLVYVIIDTPHVEDQPHSSYASGVFSKIMGEILPYLNIFPASEEEGEDELSSGQPEREGIIDNLGGEGGIKALTPEETRVYETEEYIDKEVQEDSGIPEDGQMGGETSTGTQEDGMSGEEGF